MLARALKLKRRLMTDWIGWLATAVVASSYFARQPRMLRWIQAAGAVIWMTYGILIGSMPVIVANIIVAAAALYSSFSQAKSPRTT
jgi:hypothetical protein